MEVWRLLMQKIYRVFNPLTGLYEECDSLELAKQKLLELLNAHLKSNFSVKRKLIEPEA